MTDNKALVVRQQLTPSVWEMVRSIAPAMYASRLFGVASAEAASAIMLKGYELGLPLTASFEFIQVVQGKPTLSPRGALAIIQQSGELEALKIEDGKDSCTVHMKRKNGMEYTLTWTMEDAKKAGLVKPGGAWTSYPGNMLRWRTVGFVADVVFPDIIGGMKRADELGADINADGDVIQGTWRDVTPTAAPAKPGPVKPTPKDLTELIDAYGVDDVVGYFEGTLPDDATEQQIADAATVLEAALNG